MERKREEKQDNLLPQKGNPLNETITYKIGGTIFEVETMKTPTDKREKVRYIGIGKETDSRT